MARPKDIPCSILIVGSGVFGLGTAYALTQRSEFENTNITLLERLEFPAHDASSIDSSRIVRNSMGRRIHCDPRPYPEIHLQPTRRLRHLLILLPIGSDQAGLSGSRHVI